MLKTSTDQWGLLANMNVIAQAPGGVARLRELILTLAVQGKLVAQDASDEPASELLKKIRAEKDRLIAEGKIKKDKPLPAITEDEKPFELPVGWEWGRLGDIAQTHNGYAFKSSQYKNEGTLVFRVTNIRSDGGIDLSDVKYIDDFSASVSYKNFLLDEGDILLVMVGGSLGKIGIINKECLPAVLNQNMWKIVGSNYVNNKYLINILKYINSNQLKVTNSTHGHLAQGEYLLQPVALPPLAEQSRIVARVEELMRLCDALEEKGRLEHTQHQQLLQAMLDSLTQTTDAQELARHWQRLAQHFDLLIDRPEAVDALEQTILQLAVRGLLVPQDPSDEPASELLKKIRAEKDRLIAEGKIKKDKPLPEVGDDENSFELPMGWQTERLGNLLNISSGITLGRKTAINNPIEVPYLRVANVQRWRLELTSMKSIIIDETEVDKYKLLQGDLLITEGGDWDKVGRTAIWNDDLPFCAHQNHVFKARKVSAEWNVIWSELYLNSDIARTYFASSAKQTTNLASINMTQLKNCVFPLPPLAEQSRIVARVTELRALCQQLRAKLSQARTTQTQLAQAWVEQVAA